MASSSSSKTIPNTSSKENYIAGIINHSNDALLTGLGSERRLSQHNLTNHHQRSYLCRKHDRVLNQATFGNLVYAVAYLLNLLLSAWSGLPVFLRLIITVGLLYKLYSKVTKSFQAYLDLGRGGTPSTFQGWAKIQWLGLFRVRVLEPPHVPPMLNPYRGILEHLPKRQGTRPRVGGVAPQRQLDQKTTRSSFGKLLDLLTRFAEKYPDRMEVKQSFLEGHLPALRAKKTPEADSRPQTELFGYEIVHPHRNDGSLHMVMHPDDVRTVIESGWGERHPLARANWWWLKFWILYALSPRRPPVPESFVFVYAPRTDTEFRIIEHLVAASAWWITGYDRIGDEMESLVEAKPERKTYNLRTRSPRSAHSQES